MYTHIEYRMEERNLNEHKIREKSFFEILHSCILLKILKTAKFIRTFTFQRIFYTLWWQSQIIVNPCSMFFNSLNFFRKQYSGTLAGDWRDRILLAKR